MTENAQQAMDLAKSFLSKIEDMDFDGVGEMLAPEAVIAFPFSPGAEPIEGRQAAVEYLTQGVKQTLDKISFTYDAFYPGAEPNELIVEYQSTGIRAGNNGAYQNNYIAVFRFKGDKIILWKEYFDILKARGENL